MGVFVSGRSELAGILRGISTRQVGRVVQMTQGGGTGVGFADLDRSTPGSAGRSR
ncbi:MAG TPA: hypothetical protein VN658_06205 [Candidatus Acidoferrales bacterium]|nr:hypothetical protein [Candidatus Acidoferrales bacterium]